jgi:hypothetical protein
MTLEQETLNADCTCISLDKAALCRALEAEVGDAGFCRDLLASHPTLISNHPLFMRAEHAADMAEVIRAIERVAKLPGYIASVQDCDDPIVRFRPGAIGVLMGYDFHLSEDGPKLIEINTNAGGALINAFVARAQRACCTPVEAFVPECGEVDRFEAAVLESFRSEHCRQRGNATLKRIAIVDADPRSQYLYPEFVLFERLFHRNAIDAVIAAPSDLAHRNGKLWCGEEPIDLVYNRLTDFQLAEPEHAVLRAAYLADDVVVTPNPWAHAMFADKRNLVALTDSTLLKSWGVEQRDIDTLQTGIPQTVIVTRDRANDLWARRATLFFKPVSGFGSKAAYRGDKLTRTTWEMILDGAFVAQDFAAPSTRTIAVDGQRHAMKVDVRNYAYDGTVQLVAARLYQGQTTNFRTPGGGFAPVFWDRGKGKAANAPIKELSPG